MSVARDNFVKDVNLSTVVLAEPVKPELFARAKILAKESKHKCGHCKTESESPLPHCNECGVVFYCSHVCQIEDWDKHKLVCVKIVGVAVVTATKES